MKGIIHYNQFDENGWEDWQEEYLADLCKNLVDKYGAIAKFGFFGTWNGPEFGGSIITDPKILKGHITQDFSVAMSWDLSYAESEENVEEMQRYCSPTELSVPAGSIVLRQWHHDGCNCYILRPVKSGMEFKGNGKFLDWCAKNTKKVNLQEVM